MYHISFQVETSIHEEMVEPHSSKPTKNTTNCTTCRGPCKQKIYNNKDFLNHLLMVKECRSFYTDEEISELQFDIDDSGTLGRAEEPSKPSKSYKRKTSANAGHVLHTFEGAEETELEKILRKNEYYKKQKKNPEFVQIEEAEETELEKILKKNEYYKRLKKDHEFVEILDKPDESLLPQPSKNDNASQVSTYPINL